NIDRVVACVVGMADDSHLRIRATLELVGDLRQLALRRRGHTEAVGLEIDRRLEQTGDVGLQARALSWTRCWSGGRSRRRGLRHLDVVDQLDVWPRRLGRLLDCGLHFFRGRGTGQSESVAVEVEVEVGNACRGTENGSEACEVRRIRIR